MAVMVGLWQKFNDEISGEFACVPVSMFGTKFTRIVVIKFFCH